jgi:CHASE3 domain sensor protein
LVTLCIVAALSGFAQIESTAAAGRHSRRVATAAADLLSAVRDAETGQRGYLLTGNSHYLEPYLRVHSQIRGQLG